MSGSVRKDGLLRCSFARDSHRTWPRLRPCNRLAVVKEQPQGSLVYHFLCEKHAQYVSPDAIVIRSPRGFRVLHGKGAPFEIVPVSRVSG
jgi:hypothetical protein